MNKRNGRFFITYFFTSLFFFFLLLPMFSGDAAAGPGHIGDPRYLWHLFTGSEVDGTEEISAVVSDEDGNIYIAAEGLKWDPTQEDASKYGYPGKPRKWHSGKNPANRDILVAKFNSDGDLQWYTYYGGYEYDSVRGMAIANGVLYITGTSRDNWLGSKGANPLQAHSRALGVDRGWIEYNVSADIYVLALTTDGAYKWHTFKGESKWNEEVYGIAADKERVFLVGKADAEFFGCWPKPEVKKYIDVTTPEYMERENRRCKPKRPYQGENDAWVMALTVEGQYVTHTFLGGPDSNDWGEAIAIDHNGMVVVAGSSDGSWFYDWWIGNVGQRIEPRNDHVGRYDMFIARLDRRDLNYHWHSFFGGGGDDWATALVTDDENGYYLAGYSETNWKVKDRAPVADHTSGVNYDFVVVKMNNEGKNGWHTFRGIDRYEDIPHAMALSQDKATLYVAGEARGPWIKGGDGDPVHKFTGDVGTTTDMAILGLNTDTGKSRWHTFYGGTGWDRAYGIAVIGDQSGDIIVAGKSNTSWNADIFEPIWPFPGNNEGKNDNLVLLRLADTAWAINATAGNNGSINPPGITTYPSGATPTFTFTPNNGYVVDTVKVDNKAVTFANNEYTFPALDNNYTIHVTFSHVTQYAITPSAGQHGSISPSMAAAYNAGTTPTFTFTPNNGYEVDTVRVDTISVAFENNKYTFPALTGDHTIMVTFKASQVTQYEITPSAGQHGSISPSMAAAYNAGTTPTFTFTPDSGYEVAAVRVDTNYVAFENNKYTFPALTKDHAIHVTFRAVATTYTITSLAGKDGRITPEDDISYPSGATPTYTFQPDKGKKVKGVYVDNVQVAFENNQYTFPSLDSDHTIYVLFVDLTLSGS